MLGRNIKKISLTSDKVNPFLPSYWSISFSSTMWLCFTGAHITTSLVQDLIMMEPNFWSRREGGEDSEHLHIYCEGTNLEQGKAAGFEVFVLICVDFDL